MREIAEIELAIQGGTEKIETLGEWLLAELYDSFVETFRRRARQGRGVYERNGGY